MTSQRLGRKVGFRYLMAKKSSSFLSIISAISVGGVAVGVLTLIVTLSVMSGFEQELKKRLFSAETHVMVEGDAGYLRGSGADLVSKIKKSTATITQVYPVLQAEVILKSGKKVTGSILKGIELEQLEWLKTQIVEWAPKELLSASTDGRLYLGSEMAYDMGVIPGDIVTIVSPVESEGPLGAIPRVKRFIVEGVYKTGIPEQELHVAFAKMRDVESFLKQANVLSQVEVKVRSLEDAPDAAEQIAKTLAGENVRYLVRPWQVLNAHLFQSLRLERTAMFCILIFIIIVASFNIVSTLMMMVLEKKRSLAILRTMGASRKQISSIFLWEGIAIALSGVTSGTVLGLGICTVLDKYPIIELPEVFYDRSLPVVVDPLAVCLIAGAAVFIVIFGAQFPARRASDLSPIQGIREG